MKKILAGISALAMMSIAAQAATAPSTGTTTANAQSSILDKMTLVYDGILYSPMMPQLADGKMKNGISDLALENNIALGYKLKNDWAVSTRMKAIYMVGGNNASQAALKDIAAVVSNGKLISAGRFGLAADARYYTPIPLSYQNNRGLGAVRMSAIPSFALNSKISLSAPSHARNYLYEGTKAGNLSWGMITAPTAEYSLTEKLTLGITQELYAEQNVGGGLQTLDTANAKYGANDFQAGINIQATKKIALHPYFQVNQDQGIFNNTSYQMKNISANLELMAAVF